ncbi:MAG: DUF4199 domain-containing protein [Balneolaceae bacterium]
MEKYKTEIKWGFIFTAVMLLWMVIERLMGWHSENIDQHVYMTNIFAIPAIAVYVFALIDKRKNDYLGSMTWMQGFKCGVFITLVAAVLSPLAQLIIHTVISPDFFQNMIEYSVETGSVSRENAESTFNLSSYMVQGVIGTLVMGIITSAIVALFTKKRV